MVAEPTPTLAKRTTHPASSSTPQARVGPEGVIPYAPLTVLPCYEDKRRFYVLSRREEVGWLAVFLGDATYLPTCECEHHRFRLAGTKNPCAHLKAAAAYRKQHSMQCPPCGGVMNHDLNRTERGYLLVAVCEECGYRKNF